MPKLIVLFDERDETAGTLAERAAAGANEVRFTEVDVRSIGGAAGERAMLHAASEIANYDGVLLAISGPEVPHGLAALLGELAGGGQLPNMVFGTTNSTASVLESVARVGGIIVSGPADGEASERARKSGARTAKVAGWVRHALGHEAEHHHHH